MIDATRDEQVAYLMRRAMRYVFTDAGVEEPRRENV